MSRLAYDDPATATGRGAAPIAIGLGADVTVLNRGGDKPAALNRVFGAQLKTL